MLAYPSPKSQVGRLISGSVLYVSYNLFRYVAFSVRKSESTANRS